MKCFQQKKNIIKFITIPSEKYGNKYFVYEKAYGIHETEFDLSAKLVKYKSVDSIKDLIK
tara:strand:+ start:616 stop:795 length:180 start_codon:yes stop_codon:yes gene_type:complete